MGAKQFQRTQKILLAVATLICFYAGAALLLRAIGLPNAQLFIQQAGIWAPLFFVLLCAFSLVIAPLSGSSLFVVGGTLFEKETSFALAYFASILGCSINFWLSRMLGQKVVTRFVGDRHLSELDRFTQKLRGHRVILYMTIVMLFSQDIVSYAVGLTQIRYRSFLVALMVSGAVLVAVYTYLGSSLLEAIVQG